MEHEHITIKIWRETLKLLRHIHAETGEAQVAILHRLAQQEWQRLEQRGEQVAHQEERTRTMEQNEVRYQVVAQDETNTCWIEEYEPTGYAQLDCSYSAPASLEEAQKELARIESLGYRVTGQR